MACYIVGLSYLARRESTRTTVRYWPCLFLAAPIVLALIVNPRESRWPGIWLCSILGLWILRSVAFTFWSSQRNIGRTVSGLLAGIVLVDLLAVGPAALSLGPIFLGLFLLALLFQRFVPAT